MQKDVIVLQLPFTNFKTALFRTVRVWIAALYALTMRLHDFTSAGRIVMCIALFILQGHKVTVVNASLCVLYFITVYGFLPECRRQNSG